MSADLQTFESYRPLLFSIAYRMLGSAMDAEDMVQEAYLRYEAAEDQSIRSPKAYLSTIVTRLCLDHLKSAKTQREDYVGTWLPEPLITAESPGVIVGERETISMAFMVLLENLSPLERAVFLLREVFDYPYAEIAKMVDKSEANCRRYYTRAKQFLVERRPRFDPSSVEQKKLVESFLLAVVAGDVDKLTQLLSEDAVFYADGGGKVSAVLRPITGRAAVIRLFTQSKYYRLSPEDVRVEFVEVNGSTSVMIWKDGALLIVMSFDFVGDRIKELWSVVNPDKLAYIRQHGSSPADQ
jgi:RNA polymerase sigma-70 factor (ECF subfamily)